MLSHDNVKPACYNMRCVLINIIRFLYQLQLTWTAKALLATLDDAVFGAEHIISYLPLSHIAGQVWYNMSTVYTCKYYYLMLFTAAGFLTDGWHILYNSNWWYLSLCPTRCFKSECYAYMHVYTHVYNCYTFFIQVHNNSWHPVVSVRVNISLSC